MGRKMRARNRRVPRVKFLQAVNGPDGRFEGFLDPLAYEEKDLPDGYTFTGNTFGYLK